MLPKNYIITGNWDYIKSYDYNNNQLYHIYNSNEKFSHSSIIINDNVNIIKLIESSRDGNIRIWNFHSGLLLKKIKISENYLHGIYLWNDNYLFVGCNDKTIGLVELNIGLIIKSLNKHSNQVIIVKTIIIPKYGECLISQNWKESKILLWVNKNNNS